jgi:hypothetical protein
MRHRSILVFGPLVGFVLFACGSESPVAIGMIPTDDDGGVVTQPPVVVSPPVATDDEAPPLSGTIKSYFEDIEREPPLSTGSIFATGFSFETSGGFGGAPTQGALVELLGLGTGDLTVLALFDRSVSMSDPWLGQPRWQVAGRAFMDGLTGYEGVVTLGAIFFPQSSECDVAPLSDPRQIQFQAGTRFKQQWEAFPENRFPSGGTPLGPAFERANEAILEAKTYGLIGPGRRFRVVVITDGEPNCGSDPDRILFLASTWKELGVEVHAIGLPGSEQAATFLDQLASTGGSYQAQTPTTPDETSGGVAVVVK